MGVIFKSCALSTFQGVCVWWWENRAEMEREVKPKTLDLGG